MESIMYFENLSIEIDKVELALKEERLICEDLIKKINELNDSFNLNLKEDFNEKSVDVNKSLNSILNNHENDIYVIRKNIERYIETGKEVSNNFNKI